MADNMPPLPPGFTLDAPQAPAFGGRPVIQEMPTPLNQAQLQHTQLENQTIPLQNQHTRAQIEQTQTQVKNTGFDNVNNLRKQFEAEPSTQDYKIVLPLMDSALRIQNNKAGDLNLVYAFGKAMDPGSVVREGEQVMATNVGGVSEKVKGYIDQINGQGQLTPSQRTQLIEELRNRSRALQETYNQRRSFYEDFAKRNGINPNDVVGPHPGQPFINDEKAYIEAHGGTPRDPNAPPAPSKLSTAQQKEFFGILQNRGPDAANAYLGKFGLALKDKSASQGPHSQQIDYPALQSLKEGAGGVVQAIGDTMGMVSNPVIAATNAALGTNYKPDMGANMRDAVGLPAASSPEQEMVNKAGGAALSGIGVAGLARAAIPYAGGAVVNALTNLAANPGADAVISGSSGGASEAARQNGYGPGVQMVAGLLGGAASAPAASRIAPTLLQTGRNALLRQSQAPLVDPTTGRLNEPLEAAGPAARVQAAKDFGIDIPMGSAGDKTAAIVERKLDVRPASAGVMNDHRRIVEGQAQNAAEDVAGKFGSSRTLNEGGGEVQRGLNEWMGRADKVDAKVYNAIPISPKAATTNASTVGFLQQNTSKFESNPALQEELKDPKLARYLVAIQKHGLNWQDLKDFRSYVGAKAGQFRFSQDPLKEDYRGLYGALSEDMRASAAAQGPRALKAFERANSFHAAMENRIEGAITQLLGNDAKAAPEKAAAAIQTITRGGKGSGDLAKLAQIKASTVKSGAWDEVAGTLIRIGGQPANSPGRGFDPGTFVRWYSDMAEPARQMLFKPELRKTLDQFVMVNQRLANSNALRNTSNTAMASPTGTFSIPTAGAALFTGHPMVAAGIMVATAGKTASEYGMSKLWTNPKFVQWATGYSRAAAKGNSNAVKSQIGRIGTLAAANPELREPLLALQQWLLSGANDNAMVGVAASQSNSEEQ